MFFLFFELQKFVWFQVYERNVKDFGKIVNYFMEIIWKWNIICAESDHWVEKYLTNNCKMKFSGDS